MIETILNNLLTMEYTTLAETNTTAGIHTLFTYSADVVPIFIPMVLLGFFIIATVGSYYASIRTTNQGNFPASFAAGGFVTAVLATIMSLVPGLINISTLVGSYGIAIIGVIWLFFSSKQ